MDVFLLDPVQGVALIPFNKENSLAWFVFDLFEEGEPQNLAFHEDTLETRRPIADAGPSRIRSPIQPPDLFHTLPVLHGAGFMHRIGA